MSHSVPYEVPYTIIEFTLVSQFLTFFLLFRKSSLAGDYGFDPLGLGEDPKSLKWYVQAELVHARFAMAGVAGILFTDVSDSSMDYCYWVLVELIHFIFCSYYALQGSAIYQFGMKLVQ